MCEGVRLAPVRGHRVWSRRPLLLGLALALALAHLLLGDHGDGVDERRLRCLQLDGVARGIAPLLLWEFLLVDEDHLRVTCCRRWSQGCVVSGAAIISPHAGGWAFGGQSSIMGVQGAQLAACHNAAQHPPFLRFSPAARMRRKMARQMTTMFAPIITMPAAPHVAVFGSIDAGTARYVCTNVVSTGTPVCPHYWCCAGC